MTDERPDIPMNPIDLSALDPRADAARMNALIDRVVIDGMAVRASRKGADTLVAQLSRWSRPALLAASLVLAVSLPVAVRSGRELSRRIMEASTPSTPPIRLGLPAEVIALTQAGRSPSVAEIAAAFDAERTDKR